MTSNGKGDIKDQVSAFVRETFLVGDDTVELKSDESLIDKGVIDSTGVLELVSFIEETFDIKVEDEDLVPENLDSLDRVSEYIHRKTLQ